MNLDHPNFGQTYRLSQLAIRLRTFTARELIALTGMVQDTVYGFLANLVKPGYLQWEELPRLTRGRPVKRYTLTDTGLEYLLGRNARFASILRGEEVVHSVEAAAEPAATANSGVATLRRAASARGEAASTYSTAASNMVASAE
jgi:DNA-binding PadR family transcriptional regulator